MLTSAIKPWKVVYLLKMGKRMWWILWYDGERDRSEDIEAILKTRDVMAPLKRCHHDSRD